MDALTGNVLVTGGTGTLGHAIAARVQREQWPCTLTIVSRDPLKQQQMRREYPQHRYVLADVTQPGGWDALCAGHDLVIHAAAQKHIPEAERQPEHCFLTNVIGSLNVLDGCERAGVRQIVGISTDKACWPINAYGASKFAMERIFQTRVERRLTRVQLVRYGNVLGSNGSVLPVWAQTLAAGKRPYLTDPCMSRFWLTAEQAVDLILFALNEPAGTITIPVIPALSMAGLANAVLPEAVTPEVKGLRPGEKTHEMLLTPQEAYYAERIAGQPYIRLAPVTGFARAVSDYPQGFTSDIAGMPGSTGPVADTLAYWRERCRVAHESVWLEKGGAR